MKKILWYEYIVFVLFNPLSAAWWFPFLLDKISNEFWDKWEGSLILSSIIFLVCYVWGFGLMINNIYNRLNKQYLD